MGAYDIHKVNGFSNIWACDACINEIKDLFKKDRYTATQYQKWLDKQLALLDKIPVAELILTKAFEKYSGSSKAYDLFIIRRPETTGNPRVVFSTLRDADGESHILLLAFKELHDDYGRYIHTAYARLEKVIEIIEEHSCNSEITSIE